MNGRTSRSSWIVLIVGLGLLALGVILLLNGGASCRATEMQIGGQCITYGDGASRILEPDDTGRLAGRLIIGAGGLVAAAGVWLVFFADRSIPRSAGVGDRIELARRHGWQFLDVDGDLLDAWSDTPDFGEDQPAYAVLRGYYDDLEFVVFDFRKPETGVLSTAWIVYLPDPTRAFVKWATAQEPLYRRPLTMVGVRADAIVDIAARPHRSTEADAVLRQVRALVEIVRRFESQATTSS
ncbi:hypothetical protein [Actinoplanes derwentensis]|uniref:Uncharacterized protein n=1 Tax=Actinoplanes derwentensis TaxID=113562 RepID=A0A1H2CMM6_9ACTN|nr:hypothetical protein [Actinoplanes derwentensis]GID86200.1 hypothetical protein Ade03nite_51240 [Actinoplanes derwentensis]SDT71758.1 hypothetical protein SAMN04489716_6245 [Actinoplanes derwentensis]